MPIRWRNERWGEKVSPPWPRPTCRPSRRLKDLEACKTIRAPLTGPITARNTDIGQLIKADDGGAGGAAAVAEFEYAAGAGERRARGCVGRGMAGDPALAGQAPSQASLAPTKAVRCTPVGARLARERALQSTTKPGASTHTGSPPKRNPGKAVRNTGVFRCEPTIALKVTKPSGAIMAVCSVPIPPGLIASKNDTLLAIPANPSFGPCPGARPRPESNQSPLLR